MAQPQPEEQGFLSHLIELRLRLVRAAAAILIVFAALSPFMRQIFDVLSKPFMVPLKITLFVALLVALPYVLYQAWAFIAPGLYLHERRLALPVIVSSVL